MIRQQNAYRVICDMCGEQELRYTSDVPDGWYAVDLGGTRFQLHSRDCVIAWMGAQVRIGRVTGGIVDLKPLRYAGSKP